VVTHVPFPGRSYRMTGVRPENYAVQIGSDVWELDPATARSNLRKRGGGL
jgi:hypothetical protein